MKKLILITTLFLAACGSDDNSEQIPSPRGEWPKVHCDTDESLYTVTDVQWIQGRYFVYNGEADNEIYFWNHCGDGDTGCDNPYKLSGEFGKHGIVFSEAVLLDDKYFEKDQMRHYFCHHNDMMWGVSVDGDGNKIYYREMPYIK